ncbi:hypothetical protein MC7420_118 [Coleofasciculus chthonoplastes PCC 7420]|uniref:Uncharacterized protein n=1 Tax=Coleofasciculus chthonoplastes PCC 7420 TaxID=118168 RepID=B4W4R4_9CYAN|nr:hypothetical protein MC7420_118 [Coleofasciculus chthonoplastes PCC 7420]
METEQLPAQLARRVLQALPIGLNRISWKRKGAKASILSDPTDWVKSD